MELEAEYYVECLTSIPRPSTGLEGVTSHNGGLSITLRLSPVRARGLGGEPMKRGKGCKAGMPLDRPIHRMGDDHGRHIIRQNLRGNTAKSLEGVFQARKQGVLASVVNKLDIEAPGIPQRENKNPEWPDGTVRIGQTSETGPITLG